LQKKGQSHKKSWGKIRHHGLVGLGNRKQREGAVEKEKNKSGGVLKKLLPQLGISANKRLPFTAIPRQRGMGS